MDKRVFDPFLPHCRSRNGPLSRHFGIFHGPKPSPRAQNGLKTLVWASQTVQGHFWKNAFLTHFCPCFCPKTAHFQGILAFSMAQKRATTGSKRAKNGCLSIPSGLGTTLEKMIFFDPGTLVDPPVAPTMRGPGCPPAPPSDHWYGGLGSSLGDSEGWKPQRVGGCGWTRCPRNSDLSHVAQDTARSWFWPCWTKITHV